MRACWVRYAAWTLAGLREGRTASKALGYSQALAHLDGLLERRQAIEDTITSTRRFRPWRQESWFRPLTRASTGSDLMWAAYDDPRRDPLDREPTSREPPTREPRSSALCASDPLLDQFCACADWEQRHRTDGHVAQAVDRAGGHCGVSKNGLDD
jgi:tRNA A37 N6-isopentenylltransferase MiaA